MSDQFDPSVAVRGYAELRDWYGVCPNFHDAYVNQLDIRVDGTGKMVLRGFRITSEVDEQGKYVLDKHFKATFTLEGLGSVALSEFAPDRGILFGLEIRDHKNGIEIELSPTYGVGGRISMERLSIDFGPVDYDGNWPPK